MDKVRWGIIGPGKIANRFADGLKETQNGDLSDCKCNQEKNFYNSENKEYNCIRCFPGSTLKKFDDV